MNPRALRLSTTLLVLVGALGGAGQAVAQQMSTPGAAASPPPAEVTDTDRARAAFLLGLALSQAGQWSDALAAFQRSAKLKPHPVTTYNIAYSERSLGLHASAYLHFLSALEPEALSGAPGLPAEYAGEAHAYLVEAESRVAHAQVSLAAPNVSLLVDGKAIQAVPGVAKRVLYVIGDEPGNATPLPDAFDLWLDPGAHLFSVSQPGQPDVVQAHSIAAATSIAIRLGQVPPPAVAPATPTVRPIAAPNRPADRRLALSVLGAGATGLVASGMFALVALEQKRKLDDHACPNHVCPGPYHNDEADMKAFANLATVGLAVGVAGIGVGSYLFFSAKPRADSTGSLSVSASLGLGSASVVGRF